MNQNSILLTVSLLVSNRIDTIRKCLDSIQPLLKEIPSELIVVDTVGEENSDGSLAVAREYTDKIYHFDWCDDFAAARNVGLDHAQGEWFMYLDDDEWFERTEDILEFFCSGEYELFNSASYVIHDYIDHNGHYNVGKMNRIVKLEEDSVFQGKIHEYLMPINPPMKELESYICHYGYAFNTEEEHLKHSERNLLLLRPEFEKSPWNMHLRTQMVQECLYREELWPEAQKLCEQTLLAEESLYMTPECQWIFMAYVLLAERTEDFEEVLWRAEKIKREYPTAAITQLALGVMETKAALQLKRYEKGTASCINVIGQYDFLKKNPEERVKQSILNFPTFLEPNIIGETLQRGCVCYLKMGRMDWARRLQGLRNSLGLGPVLTISLLVSNNIGTVRQCLDSIKPLLDSVPSELIVVDTVGQEASDGSLAVAREYTDKIYHFDWCDDFSAARNVGLEQAKGQWFLFLDDDEWFDSVEEIKEFFLNGEYLEYKSATYQIRNYKDRQGSDYSLAVLARMVCLNKKIHFVGKIHEAFSEFALPCKAFQSYVHHYGYVYENEEEKQAHMKRNQELLKQELEKEPSDLRYRTQMALELATCDNEASLEFCKETFRLCEKEKDNPMFQWQLSLVFCLYEALGITGSMAEETYQKYKEQYGFSETAENAVCYQMTRLFLLENAYSKAYPYAARYFETYRFLEEYPEEAQMQMAADFAKYRAKNKYLEMLDFAAFTAWQSKDYTEAWNYYAMMPWEQVGYTNEDALWKVFAMAEEVWDVEKLYSIIKRATGNVSMKPILGKLMQNPVIKQRISNTLQEMARRG